MSASASSFAKGRPWAWYLAAALAATGVHILLPAHSPASAAIFLAINASVVGALAWGIRWHRPDPRAAWFAFVIGYAVFLAGNALDQGAAAGLPVPLPLPSSVDGLYLATYAALGLGLMLVLAGRGSLRDLAGLADALIVVSGIGFFAFDLLIGPVLGDTTLSPATRFMLVLYPMADQLVLLALLWLAFTPGPRGLALSLFIGGVAAQTASDIGLGLSGTGITWAGVVADPLKLLSLGLVGAAALHPSMAALATRGGGQPWIATRWRLSILVLVSAAVMVHILVDTYGVGTPDAVAAAVAVVVMFALIFLRFRGLLVDVDTYTRTLAKLTKAEARFRRLVEQVPAVIYIDSTDEAASSRYVSPRYEELTGHSPEEAVTHPWLWANHIHPDDREWVMAASSHADERDEPRALEYRIIAGDGRELWVRDEAAVTGRDADGRACTWQGTLVDVTEDHRAEDQIRRLNAELEQRIAERTAELRTTNEHLREANTYLENLVSGMPAMLFRGHGPNFKIEYISTGVEQILGFTPVDVIARPRFWMERLHPDDRRRVAAEVRDATGRRLPLQTLEQRVIHRDGSERWLHAVVRFEFEADGVWIFTGSAIDITERRHVEDELRLAKAEAERANRAKSEFLSSMSHELRTPLNSVLGFGQLLERSALAPDDRDSVAQVLRAGRTLLAMIDSVLDLARVESGRLTLSIEPVSVAELIQETVDLVRPIAAGRGIRLVTPADVERPPWVLADRLRVQQVILNVLRNALTYNRDDGSVTIAYRVAAGDRLRLSVTDTGPGIPAERQATLFTILDRRIGSDGTSAGLGVGLALSARLIEAMNGSISVESEVGAGSTFSIELPLAAEPAVGSGERSEPGTGAPAGATVVYVEDNLANLKLIERILEVRPGTRVLAAMQGSLGLDLARQHHPDLVLLDLHLPDMYGEEVLRLLQDDPVTRDIPVIVLSSALGNGTGQQLLDLGAKAYFAKPIDVAAFLAAVDRVLRGGVTHA
jgi:PAS domain S-box-containing protein